MKIGAWLSERPALGASLVMGVSTVVRTFTGLAKTKISAVFLGPVGVGALGLAGQVQLLGLSWGSLSLASGFIQRYSAAIAAQDLEERRKLLATTFTVLFVCNSMLALGTIIAWQWLGLRIFGDQSLAGCLIPIALTLPIYVLVGCFFQGVLFAHGKFEWWSRASSLAALPELFFFVLGAWKYGPIGALGGLGIGMLFWASLLLRYCLRLETSADLFRFRFHKSVARSLATSGMVLTFTGSCAYLAGVLIRVFLVRYFGHDANGAYQTATILTGLYIPLVTNSIWAQLFPSASGEVNQSRLDSVWRESIYVTASLAAVCVGAVLLVPNLLIRLFLGKAFGGAAALLYWQGFGDFFFLIAQPSLAVLLGRRKLKAYAGIWFGFYAIQALAPFLLSPFMGAKSVPMAYLIASVALSGASISIYFRFTTFARWKLSAFLVLLATLVGVIFLFSRSGDDFFGLVPRVICLAALAALAMVGLADSRDIYGKMRFKTRLLNQLRRPLQGSLVEQRLANWFARNRRPAWQAKILPNHYQFPKPSLRLVERAGIRYSLDIADFLDWHIYFGLLEGPKDKLYSLSNPGDVVIDVGANIGETSLGLASRVGKRGRVIAFEPDPAMVAKCQRNFELNECENLLLEPLALGDAPANHLLASVSARNPGGNRILPAHSAEVSHAVAVRAVRLDDYLAEKGIDRVSLIKIDVEGFEHNVLRGAKSTIEKSKPRLFVELSTANLREQGSSPSAIVSEIRSWGYRVVHAESGAEIDEHSLPEHVHMDVICFPN